MHDTISRQKLLCKMQRVATEAWKMNLTAKVETIWNQAIDFVKQAPSTDDCTGCVHYDQQQTAMICRDCKRYHKDMYKEL